MLHSDGTAALIEVLRFDKPHDVFGILKVASASRQQMWCIMTTIRRGTVLHDGCGGVERTTRSKASLVRFLRGSVQICTRWRNGLYGLRPPANGGRHLASTVIVAGSHKNDTVADNNMGTLCAGF